MDQPPRAKVEMIDFPGLILSADPHRLPPGAAQDQVNCMALDGGRLRPRGGVRTVSFEWSATE